MPDRYVLHANAMAGNTRTAAANTWSELDVLRRLRSHLQYFTPGGGQLQSNTSKSSLSHGLERRDAGVVADRIQDDVVELQQGALAAFEIDDGDVVVDQG